MLGVRGTANKPDSRVSDEKNVAGVRGLGMCTEAAIRISVNGVK